MRPPQGPKRRKYDHRNFGVVAMAADLVFPHGFGPCNHCYQHAVGESQTMTQSNPTPEELAEEYANGSFTDAHFTPEKICKYAYLAGYKQGSADLEKAQADLKDALELIKFYRDHGTSKETLDADEARYQEFLKRVAAKPQGESIGYQKCDSCGALWNAPVLICPVCGTRKMA
jgi:rubrerythrin